MEQASTPATQAQTAAENVTKATTPEQNQGGVVQAGDQPDQSAVKEAAQEAIRKYKLKVDGEEVEVDEEELKRGYTHQRAANKKLQEGLKYKKQAEGFIQALKDKGQLFEAIKKLGHDPRKLAEEYLAQQLEDEMLDPKEKELRAYRRRIEEFEAKEKKSKEDAEKRAVDELKAKIAQKYNDDFVAALKETGLPPSKQMVASMAKYIARSAKLNMPMTALEAAKLVQQDEETRDQRRLKDAPPDLIAKILGEEGLKKLREYDLSRVGNPAAELRTPPIEEQAERRRSQTKRMTPQEWRAYNRK